jgi:hypothetical protein
MEKRGTRLMLRRFEDETSCSILRERIQKLTCMCLGCIFREEMTNRTDTPDFGIGYLTGLFDMVSHSEFRIQVKAEISDSVREGDRMKYK